MKSFKTTFFSLLAISLLCSCSVQQNINSTETQTIDKRKCYERLLIPLKNEMHYSDFYAIYTGDEEEEDVEIEIIKVVIKPLSTYWVKKKVEEDCVSPYPNDCMVLTKVDKPSITQEIKVLKDTTQSKNFEYRRLEYEEVKKKEEQYTEWRQILCDDDITPEIVMQIKTILDNKGYYIDFSVEHLDSDILEELRSFQRANNLPQGYLDYETLDVLGVIIE